VSVVIAVLAVLRFYTALKKDLEHHKPLAKFIAFKLIIFLTFVQKVCSISEPISLPTPSITIRPGD